MTRWCGVKTETEHRQDRCLHRLERLDPAKENGFRYRCVLCGRHMLRKNGVVLPADWKNYKSFKRI